MKSGIYAPNFDHFFVCCRDIVILILQYENGEIEKMIKKELIQIRVTEDEKRKIKIMSAEKGMTVSEFTLYSLMRTISEYELLDMHCKKYD